MRRRNPDVKILSGVDFNGPYFYEIKPNSDLEGANLVCASLKNADLRGANLRGAYLEDAEMQEANLEGAHLEKAHCDKVNLEGANLEGAHLDEARLDRANLEGANLRNAHLNGARLIRVRLQGAHLEGAHLEGAELERAHLEGAHLEGAHLEGARFYTARLQGANLQGAHLMGAWLNRAHLENADFTDADLTGAHLKEADFSQSILTGAILENAEYDEYTKFPQNFDALKYLPRYYADSNLEGADLRGKNFVSHLLMRANLKDARLESVNLDGANMADANLEGANLEDANLYNVNLSNAHLEYARLEGANLIGTNLYAACLDFAHLEKQDLRQTKLAKATFRNAHLEGANLSQMSDLGTVSFASAHLEGANLKESNLRYGFLEEAHLEGASLNGTMFRGAHLERANLEGANLEGADLSRAYLNGTNFTDADLTGADLTGTDLSKAILTGAILYSAVTDRYTVFPAHLDWGRLLIEGTELRSYGEMTGSVLKLGKPDSPQRAADFKRKYPLEFERLIKDTSGKDFTDSVKESIRNKYRTPFDWYVTRNKYEDYAQRLSKEPNDVILLNVNLGKIRVSARQFDFLRNLALVSARSGHPHENVPLFTIGWVRFDVDSERKLYLVEEVQSDVQVVRQQTKNMDAKTRDQLEDAGIDPEDFDEVYEILRPYADRFYEDALGILFIEAEEKGYSVEMLGYGDKKEFDSPRSIYTDLPRKMGMRPQPTQTDLSLQDEVSYYKPNPSRPRRRY